MSTTTTTKATTSSSEMTSSSPRIPIHKGKDTRSWQQLPPEIIRHIATHYLVVSSVTGYIPNTWEQKESWPSRLLYTAMRDANDLEKLMAICPSWQAALEYHTFWQHACAVIDPHDTLIQHSVIRPPTNNSLQAQAPVIRLPPYRHFRNIAINSCIVCRLNSPFTSLGLTAAKRHVMTPYLQVVTTCKEHRKATYCSLCLRAAPVDDTHAMVCCAENEDQETWPGVDATCRTCRVEALWQRASTNALDREALNGHPNKWRHIPDWETRQAVDTFVDMGEGRISDVLCLAREKHWLRGNTKISELLSQALAASRYVARAEGTYEGNLDGSDDDLSGEDEDDPELMSLTEDAGGIRELAISDWARNRILDGHWLSPADQWYELSIPGQPTVVRAQHPCPWLGVTYSGALVDGESGGDGEELEHPRPRTSNASCPPTYGLCDHVYRVFQRVMREILLPAMSNIVRRIMVESSADGIDPIAQVKKMSLSDVVAELRDQATWMKGVDWLERRSLRERVERHRRANHEEDDSTSSSRSDNSHTTSPVLSTSTLQTTPSPPPCGKLDESATSPTIAAIMDIPRSPTVLAKELLRPIPYIPETVSHLPHYSTECLSTVWREACAPLYQCRCSICERAILRVNMETDKVINAAQEQQYPQTQYSVPQNRTLVQKPVQIHIEQVPEIIARREEEEEEEDPDAEYDDEGESETEYFDLSPWESIVDVTPPSVVSGKGPEHIPVTPTRKRSHEEIQEVPDDNLDMLLGVQTRSKGATTPPKRARLEGSFSVSPSKEPIPSPSPGRLRKRSSAEIEDVEAISKEQSPKRLKSAFTDDTGRVKRVEAVR